MFTRQANQIQTALRGAFQSQGSAQDLTQALCNCAQTLEHRGPAQFTYQDPWSGLYPGIAPPPGNIEPYRPRDVGFPPVVPNNIAIQMPVWNPMSWDNIPFVDVAGASGGVNPYDPTPGGGVGFNPVATTWAPQPAVSIPGGMETGPINAGPVTTTEVYTQEITNEGDNYFEGNTYNEGDVYVEGNTYNQNSVFNGGPVTNQGPVTNVNTVTNGGPVSHFSSTNMFGPVFVDGRMFVRRGPFRIDGPIIVRGVPMAESSVDVLTDIWFNEAENTLEVSRARLFFLGSKVLLLNKVACG